MADKDDVFKRYLEAGLSFFEMTQQRAEAALKDLAGSGESAKGQAQKAVDWMKERGRQGTDELRDLVRNEIRSQVDGLGLATKDDLARLESRLAELESSAPASSSAAPARTSARKAAASQKAAGVTKSAAGAQKATRKAAGTTVPSMRKAAGPTAKRAGIVPPVDDPGRAPDVGAATDEKA